MASSLSQISKIKNLPPYVQFLIAAIPTIIFIVLFVVFIFLPKNKEFESLKIKTESLDKEIASGIAKIKRLDTLIAENTALKSKLQTLKEQLPEEKEVSILLKQISELGLQAGLEILLWKPEARRTDPAGLYVEIPVKVEVIAEYHKLGDFFSHISRLPRLVNIADISLKKKDMTGERRRGTINSSFTALTFASAGPQDVVPGQEGAVQ